MAIGTAGYTAARCVIALEAAGLTPDDGPGAGDRRERRRRLDRGRHPRRARLRGRRLLRQGRRSSCKALGASEVISREDAAGDARRPLEKTRWAGAVDCVGGEVLAGVIRGLRYGGAVAACGNTGGVKLPTTVLPFILRGVSLLGVDSVQTPIEERARDLAAARRPICARRTSRTRSRARSASTSLDDALTAILRGRGPGADDRRRLASFQPRDELVEAQLLEPLADGLELGGAELDERAALAAQLQRLAQAGLPGIQPGDDRLQPRAGGLVGQRFLDIGHEDQSGYSLPGRIKTGPTRRLIGQCG